MMSRMLSAIAFTVAGALSAASDLHHSEYVDPVVKQADRGAVEAIHKKVGS